MTWDRFWDIFGYKNISIELHPRPAYLLACYASVAEKHDWKRNDCECLPEEVILNSHSSFRWVKICILGIFYSAMLDGSFPMNK